MDSAERLGDKPCVEFAECRGLSITREDADRVFLHGVFDFFDNTTRDFEGQVLDDEFIRRFLEVFEAEDISDVADGRNCLILRDADKIYRISNGRRSFDVEAWRKEKESKT